MYTINLLNENPYEWKPLTFKEIPMRFSSKQTLFKALKDTLGQDQQIIYDGWFLELLDGTPKQLEWFIENHDRLLNKTLQAIHTQEIYEKRKVLKYERQTNNI